MGTVALLLQADGSVISVYDDVVAAHERAAKFNADPYLAPGCPDPGAPYTVQVWGVCSLPREGR